MREGILRETLTHLMFLSFGAVLLRLKGEVLVKCDVHRGEQRSPRAYSQKVSHKRQRFVDKEFHDQIDFGNSH